ncbi:extracellular solute-binding protein [Paenibacillus oenotherae]|uniref:Extracellular solute-binding protein n=1 Tax=Paenibacillus oenotherae TaxID=1435645 RepID=A0ABS7DAX8_9BACL|nr:extracellular solute-binding protein [Paenibacillus oenotherae]MBW7476908.1 extracellular solute-binding protein [Paenibacillus oenotherae]
MGENIEIKREMTIWHEFDGPGDTSIEVLEEICRLYSERHDINVTPEVMNIAELGTALGNVRKTGKGPQLAFVPSDMITYNKVGLYSLVPEELYGGLMSDASLATMQFDGGQYGVPVLLGNHLVCYYNKEIYEEAPLTWESIEAQADNLLESGIKPFGADLSQAYVFIAYLTAFGGWPLKDGRPNLATEEMEQALAFLNNQTASGRIISLDGATELLEQFIAGKIGAIISGEWIFNHLSRNMEGRLGVGQLPSIRGNPSVSMTSSIGLVFPNHSLESEYGEDIKSFVRFMLSEECQLLWANRVQRIPANTEILEKLEAAGSPNKRMLISLLKHCHSMPVSPFMIIVWIAIACALEVLKTEGPERALDLIDQKLDIAVSEMEASLNRTNEEMETV